MPLPLFLFQLAALTQVIHTRYWDNGKIQMHFVYHDTAKKYVANWYYLDGTIKAIEEYSNCDSLKLNESDTIIFHRYQKYKCDAHFTQFYKSGLKESDYSYKNGLEDGLSIRWYENGKKLEESYYKMGHKDSLNTKWYSNGAVKERGFHTVKYSKRYRDTPEILLLHIHQGKPLIPFISYRKKKMLCSLRNGKWEYYSEDGKLIKEEHYKKGKLKKRVEYK